MTSVLQLLEVTGAAQRRARGRAFFSIDASVGCLLSEVSVASFSMGPILMVVDVVGDRLV